VNAPDPLYPTFAQFRDILTQRFRCIIDPPIPNLVYSPVTITTFRRTVGGVEVTWTAYMNDDEMMTRELAIAVCRRLRIYPGSLTFLNNPPVP
jgi:hypothetical protein